APSGKFIAQLFLVPLGIVCAGVVIFYVFNWLTGGLGGPDAWQCLGRLKDPNAEIRWRAADDMVQLREEDLTREVKWISDGKFALDLTEQLEKAAQEPEPAEQHIIQQLRKLTAADTEREREFLLRRLEIERSYLEYLTGAVGRLMLPVGVPLLSELALKEEGATPETIALRRRQAVWALVNLGRNLERLDRLPQAQQHEALRVLSQEAERTGHRAEWARQAQAYLVGRQQKEPRLLGLDVTMAKCASAPDPELRKVVAMALLYWEGDAEENARL